MSNSALDLSKYIVSKCIRDKSSITNIQLQNILYCIQKEFLSNGKIAFRDNIEAWQICPVVPEVFYYYCGFGTMPISNAPNVYTIDSMDKNVVDITVEAKRKLYPWDMVKETQKSGGAWDIVYNGGRGEHNIIPIELIRAAE